MEPPYRDGKRGDGREKEPTGSQGDFPGTVSFCGKAKQRETSRCNTAAKLKWKAAALLSGAKQQP